MEDEDAAKTVDVVSSSCALLLRLLAYSYVVPTASGERPLSLAVELMHATMLLANTRHACRQGRHIHAATRVHPKMSAISSVVRS